MLTAVTPLRSLLFAATLAALGCHGQVPDASAKLSPEQARRVEVLIRSKSNVPANYTVEVGPRTKSDLPGFDTISVVFTADGKSSKPVLFLLSADGKTLGQFNTFDISKDPKELVSGAGRPARGGPEKAPVLIVGFDDLECPYCARMHGQLFPALLERYKDQVRVVYRDLPIEGHPWAMRAAVDTNCVGAHSQAGYWNLVDYIHLHASELGGTEKSVAKANETLDTLTRDEGKRQNVDAGELQACIAKQDDTSIRASMKEAQRLGVDATPALFVNGELIPGGAVPLPEIYSVVDRALLAAGQKPPSPPSPTTASAPAAKSGN